MNSLDTLIGQRIFDLRIERDIQQGELAQAVGLHQSVLNRIEKGTRPAKATEIRQISVALAVSSDTILDLSPINDNGTSDDAPSSLFSLTEEKFIHKYRRLDERGKNAVLSALDNELKYINTAEEEKILRA